MEAIADFHIHSRFAMACSKNITLQGLDLGARQKGISVIGTGDFTHPTWLNEIKNELVPAEQGLFKRRNSDSETRFALSAEVCTVFESAGKSKKIHNCILVPTLEAAEEINQSLSKFGDLRSDGRPLLGMSAAQMVETLMGISKDVFVFPAHAWTPWFGVFGAFSGFDSMEEAYEDQVKHIHALETGLSSDPEMNWRISKLDKYALLSNSDPHSIPKIGREANVFDFEENELSYNSIIKAIKGKDKRHFKMTIEFYPEEGKYHYDGHRGCDVSLSPEESKKYNGRCPVCGKRLTIGVEHRVEELADRPQGYKPKDAIPFVHVVPLIEVLSYVTRKGDKSMHVQGLYTKLIEKFGSEFNVTIKADIDQIKEVDKDLAAAIEKVRSDDVNLIPGYDGVFGTVDILKRIKAKPRGMQKSL
ncbi:MAG: DNA helicase UvrD [Candidatus Micrarchaeota archaeon]|nr:DNA helicase UvrD [Candidatus Micrarchaeota archaeon]MDE1848219.1 DNA helicase UvrD [Candidatus Micrarchaeota archaeon]MDE1864895.1 DNA helicase UvrD [Candidatus Micrarchaeota archaeon]